MSIWKTKHIMGLERNLSKEADVRTSFAQRLGLAADWCDVARLTVDVLPDVALLRIFDFYQENTTFPGEWRVLVQVCRKWRTIVFGSPRRLRLNLYCTPITPVRETLDVWPPLPIHINVEEWDWGDDVDNILAALKHNDRTCGITLRGVPSSQLETILAEMQQPFPALSNLFIWSNYEIVPTQPDSFLGGSAPSLEILTLVHVPFPGLPKLLLSATSLFYLYLQYDDDSGYIPPEALVTCLSVLTRLQILTIEFESPLSHPDWKSHYLLPLTRTLLPVFTYLRFKGASEYLEHVVARIDAPLLHNVNVTFFHQQIFDTSQFTRFLNRTPKIMALDKVHVLLGLNGFSVTLPPSFEGGLHVYLENSLGLSDRHLSSLAQICISSLPQVLIRAVEYLYITDNSFSRDNIESNRWLEVLHTFTAVKSLYIFRQSCITPALQELVKGRVTEVLPALQTLFLQEPVESGSAQETIRQFVAARQLAGLPISISRWDGKLGD